LANSNLFLNFYFRNVIVGAALFKRAGMDAGKRRHSTVPEDSISLADPACDGGSRTSVDSNDSTSHKVHGTSFY
jgi:hypothetical protein